jgi:hypothetical protein
MTLLARMRSEEDKRKAGLAAAEKEVTIRASVVSLQFWFLLRFAIWLPC